MKESLHVLYALGLIIPLMIGVVYCLKRLMGPRQAQLGLTRINVTHQVPLGTKERLVRVELDNTALLLGVTPHSITTLHVFTPNTPTYAEEKSS